VYFTPDSSLPVDPEVLAMLADLQMPGEPDLLREVVVLFLRDTPERLEALTTAVAASDFATAARAAHSIKGSAANLGAMGLHAVAASAEQDARSGDMPALTIDLQGLAAEYARVRAQLEDLLSARPH